MCAQARKRTVEYALNKFMGVKIPQGLAHRKVKAPVESISIASWRLIAAGAVHELFGKKVVKDW